jgi:hypothetical protein
VPEQDDGAVNHLPERPSTIAPAKAEGSVINLFGRQAN